jgi:hypothetical protein
MIVTFVKAHWNKLGGLAVWGGTTVNSWCREPLAVLEQVVRPSVVDSLYLALPVGILAYPLCRYQSRPHAVYWQVSTVVIVALAVAAYLASEHLLKCWSCEYADGRILVGVDSELTEHAKAFKAANPSASDHDLVMSYTGQTSLIWNRGSIDRRRLTLQILHAAVLPLAAVSLICVTQTCWCVSRHTNDPPPSHGDDQGEPAARPEPPAAGPDERAFESGTADGAPVPNDKPEHGTGRAGLTGEQMERLRDAFCEAYDYVSFDQMMLMRLSRKLSDITSEAGFRDVAFRVITVAVREGWVTDLVTAARDYNPGNPVLRKFCEDNAGLVSRDQAESLPP